MARRQCDECKGGTKLKQNSSTKKIIPCKKCKGAGSVPI